MPPRMGKLAVVEYGPLCGRYTGDNVRGVMRERMLIRMTGKIGCLMPLVPDART